MPTTIILSGYFNPLHRGHVRMIRAARALGDKLVVIVNNDVQQHLKKGKIIMPEDERVEVVSAIQGVDEVMLSIDHDRTVMQTLESLALKYKGQPMIFANGGDRDSPTAIPETAICEKFGIELRFGVGGDDKPQSSTNINRARGLE